MKQKQNVFAQQRGFTVVELMIATLIFAVILTIIAMGIISFSNRYYKVANISTTQNTAQSIVDTIGQSLQFGTAEAFGTGPTNNFFCAGGNVFMFNEAEGMYSGTCGQLGLYMTPMDGLIVSGSLCHIQPITGSSRQLLGTRSRITNLTVNPVAGTNMYTIDLSIASGDDDLLCTPTIANSCDSGSAPLNANDFKDKTDVQCKLITGSQYCAASHLSTSVEKRV